MPISSIDNLFYFYAFLIQYNRRYHKQFIVVFLLFCHSLDCNEAKVFETLFSWSNASNILEGWVVGGEEGVRQNKTKSHGKWKTTANQNFTAKSKRHLKIKMQRQN